MKKIILVCGLVSGFILCVFMVINTIICYQDQDFEKGMVYGYASMILALSLIFVGIKNYRDKYNGGTISFGQGFKIGLYITLVASTMYVLTWLIEYYLFIPDFMDKYAAHMLKQGQSEGMNPQQLTEQAKEVAGMKEMYRNPVMVILLTYMEVLPVGLILSVISALILKSKTGKEKLAVTG